MYSRGIHYTSATPGITCNILHSVPPTTLTDATRNPTRRPARVVIRSSYCIPHPGGGYSADLKGATRGG